MATQLQIGAAFTARASAALTSSFVAADVFQVASKPDGFSIACTYTRSAGVAGYGEMTVECSTDNSTWYYMTTLSTNITASDPYGIQQIYIGRYLLPKPASDSAISFTIPVKPDSGYSYFRLSFREASGLTAGTLAVSVFHSLATV